jgi:hypothetical protein
MEDDSFEKEQRIIVAETEIGGHTRNDKTH